MGLPTRTRDWSKWSKWSRRVATLSATALVALSAGGACGDRKSQDSVSVSISPSAATPTCEPGKHPAADGAGGCVPDEAPEAPEASASAAASAPPKPGDPTCPDLAHAERIASFDWSSAFGLDAAKSARARGTTGTAAETKAFAADVEGELRSACSRLARDLGGAGAFASAEAACLAANEAVRSARAKLAPSRVNVSFKSPQCFAPAQAFDECMRACDPAATLPAGVALCAKGSLGGKCSGACEGSCVLAGGAKCPGSCQGECEGAMVGTCDGTCVGRCDGRDMTGSKSGPCKGSCEGRCTGGSMRGECRGKCEGACSTRAETCPGFCAGRCSTGWREVECGSGFAGTPAEGQCEAFCTTRADRKATCAPARAEVQVDKPKDAAAAQRFAAALERSLPAVVRLSQGLRGRLAAASSRNEKAVADGVKALTGEAEPKATAGFGACMGPVFRAVADGSASLRTNLKAAELVEAGARGR